MCTADPSDYIESIAGERSGAGWQVDYSLQGNLRGAAIEAHGRGVGTNPGDWPLSGQASLPPVLLRPAGEVVPATATHYHVAGRDGLNDFSEGLSSVATHRHSADMGA